MRVGIDLGTTYCAVAYVDPDNGKAKIIKNRDGKSLTPSVLYFSPDGGILWGEEAKFYVEEGSDCTASYFKYHMGDEDYTIWRNGREYSAVDLSAELLKGIVREAEETLGEGIHEAVITVPAYFDHLQREATMEAGRKAGLHVLNIISEPTAAVFAYGMNKTDCEKTVLVYDLGGGTFDVTVARITRDEIHVLGTDGDHRLGGKDWDDALANYLADRFCEEFDMDISADVEMNIRLQAIAEYTKKQLSAKHCHRVTIQYEDYRGCYEITEELFDEITSYYLNKTKDIIRKLFDELQISWRDIDGVLPVGGSTRMRQVGKYLTKMCKVPSIGGVNVDEAVALGAAIRANIDVEGRMQIGPSSSGYFSIGGSTEKEPMYFIAGAKKIRDATAHSMGMIALSKDGTRFVNQIMIGKNTAIPASKTKTYELGMSANGDNRLEVYMLQGEEEELTYPLNCSVLGKYVFTGLVYGSERMERVDVTYSYDENNIVKVSAEQVRISKKLDLHIEPVEEDMSWVADDPKKRMTRPSSSARNITRTVMFAIDLSGSMSYEPLEKAKRAAENFVREFDFRTTKIGLIIFADQCRLFLEPTHNPELALKKIREWRINAEGIGSGNLADPFDMARDILKGSRSDVKYLLVLTDGVWCYQDRAVERAVKCHKSGIEIIALGFGFADKGFLEKIASRKNFATYMNEITQLESVLLGIAKII